MSQNLEQPIRYEVIMFPIEMSYLRVAMMNCFNYRADEIMFFKSWNTDIKEYKKLKPSKSSHTHTAYISTNVLKHLIAT